MNDGSAIGGPSGAPQPGATPVAASERVVLLDMLRGMALLGVLLVHCYSWPAWPYLTTKAQFAALTASTPDRIAEFLITWLLYDKANTLFAFLFGVGFWAQMQRMAARGGNFERIYLRRLTVLLAIGLVHLCLIWPFDILTVYALAGFALFALRGAGNRTLLIGGILLALFGRLVSDHLFEIAGISGPAADRAYADAAILARQNAGSYGALIVQLARLNVDDFLANGWFVGFLVYALGRFMLGAYVARRGWLQRAGELLPRYRALAWIALPLGLAGEFVAAALHLETFPALAPLAALEKPLHFVSVPLLAIGYLCLIVLVLHSRMAGLTRLFVPVGRMALTNYVTQSVALGFVLYKVPPALGLIGTVGPAVIALIGLAIFIAQILLSHWWLARFSHGPLEWCWRALTYGTRPAMRITRNRAVASRSG